MHGERPLHEHCPQGASYSMFLAVVARYVLLEVHWIEQKDASVLDGNVQIVYLA
jgi:hypothetical protein